MFRRHWSGLPKDVSFPSDLKGLGYFVNEDDEIRSIENPDCYFKFFLNRNPRINVRQRFEFNHAMEAIIHERLEKEGLQKITLPLGTPTTKPHVPIFVSPDLKSKSRIVVIFGEPVQELGLVAGRIANGPGGINEGSMVPVVRAIKAQESSDKDSSPPGIILANTGQLHWWPEGKRAITVTGSAGVPLPSLVHMGRRHVPEINDIPGNENPAKHVNYMFNEVIAKLAGEQAKMNIIAIGETCEIVERFLDNAEAWAAWGSKLNSMILLGPVYTADSLTNEGFKEFLAKRSRAYLVSPDPVDTPLAPPNGNLGESIPPLGCPCFSSSEAQFTELILIQARTKILSYIEYVAVDPNFENPVITVAERPEKEFTGDDWINLPDEQRPRIATVDREAMKKELKQLRRWRKFEETGEAPDTDSDSDSDF